MDLLSKQKYLLWIIGILVILNLVTITFLWLGKPKQLPAPPEIKARLGDFIAKELRLTPAQKEKFNEYRQEHFDTTNYLSRQINDKKKEIMKEVFSTNPDKDKVHELAEEIGNLNVRQQEFLFNHFMKLKSALRADQVKRLKNLVHNSMRLSPPPKSPALPLRPPKEIAVPKNPSQLPNNAGFPPKPPHGKIAPKNSIPVPDSAVPPPGSN